MISSTGFISKELENVAIPKMFHAKQTFPSKSISAADVPETVKRLLSDESIAATIEPGAKIAIAAGSRGIRNIDAIIATVVDFVKSRGARPFIFPAMGSHGGATAEGQRDVLATLGITEERMGCPVVSDMTVVEIGTTAAGKPVRMDRNAWESDGVIVPCRVKPHTTFRGKVGSGICKMMTVGMGKQAGAAAVHADGPAHMGDSIVSMAEVVIASGKVLFALPCIENAYDQTTHIETVMPECILDREPQLLKMAFDNMPRLIVGSGDVLIVDEIGKEFGGTGADPNITGRFPTPFVTGGAHVERLAFLNLSEATHGNAMGLGLADVITEKIFDSMNFDFTYANCLTSKVLTSGRIPCILPTDKQAVQFCLKTVPGTTETGNARVIRIPNTLEIGHIMLSEAYYGDTVAGAFEGLEALDEPAHLKWDASGNLATPIASAFQVNL